MGRACYHSGNSSEHLCFQQNACNISVIFRQHNGHIDRLDLSETPELVNQMRLLDSIHRVDLSAFSWFVKYKHREQIIRISRYVSISADGPLYVIAGVAFLALQNWDIAQLMALAFLLERTCYKFAKGLFKRNRPPEAIPGFKSVVEPSDRFSFPSGHTSAAFMVACIFTYFFPAVGIILFPWAIMVGIARVVLGVHFPSDVIAGVFMGFMIFIMSTTILF